MERAANAASCSKPATPTHQLISTPAAVVRPTQSIWPIGPHLGIEAKKPMHNLTCGHCVTDRCRRWRRSRRWHWRRLKLRLNSWPTNRDNPANCTPHPTAPNRRQVVDSFASECFKQSLWIWHKSWLEATHTTWGQTGCVCVCAATQLPPDATLPCCLGQELQQSSFRRWTEAGLPQGCPMPGAGAIQDVLKEHIKEKFRESERVRFVIGVFSTCCATFCIGGHLTCSRQLMHIASHKCILWSRLSHRA